MRYCPWHMKISWESQKEFGHLFENCKKITSIGGPSLTPHLCTCGSDMWCGGVYNFSISNFTAIKQTRLIALRPGLPRSASTRKVKPIWILLKQDTVSGSGISWAIWKSAICSRHNHASTPPLSFVQARCPSCHLTNSIKALKALPSVQRITSKLPWMTNTTVCAENVASEIFHPSTTKLGMETHRVTVA